MDCVQIALSLLSTTGLDWNAPAPVDLTFVDHFLVHDNLAYTDMSNQVRRCYRGTTGSSQEVRVFEKALLSLGKN